MACSGCLSKDWRTGDIPGHKNDTKDWFMKAALQLIKIRSLKKQLCCCRTKPMVLSHMNKCLPLVLVTTLIYLSSHIHVFAIQR